METPNYRKASIYFDDETVLEVTQRGGGGSGVGGETGLEAVNLITGESTNAALAEKDETIIELQEELADVPTIEALNVTANGTYAEEGKAYSPVNVNVPAGEAVLSKQIAVTLVNNKNTDIEVPILVHQLGTMPMNEAQIRTVGANSTSYWNFKAAIVPGTNVTINLRFFTPSIVTFSDANGIKPSVSGDLIQLLITTPDTGAPAVTINFA